MIQIQKKYTESIWTSVTGLLAVSAFVFVQDAVYWFDNFYVVFSVAGIIIASYLVATCISFVRSLKETLSGVEMLVIYFSVPASLVLSVFMFLLTVMWLG
ncbi:hypothetical protein [Listeria booriae]|uniref:hypothetical protein n=1 Tax=Listeria booriae TaxID=1552123 RepID=UPI00162507F2|nr:hypothetical protein [Listeria booriae]MBC2257661.1 hypothetical protein [Listeria booriae]